MFTKLSIGLLLGLLSCPTIYAEADDADSAKEYPVTCTFGKAPTGIQFTFYGTNSLAGQDGYRLTTVELYNSGWDYESGNASATSSEGVKVLFEPYAYVAGAGDGFPSDGGSAVFNVPGDDGLQDDYVFIVSVEGDYGYPKDVFASFLATFSNEFGGNLGKRDILMKSFNASMTIYGTMPIDDDITTPGDDDITTPGDGDITTPGDDDITTPGDGDITTPGDGDITTPGDDDITTPGDGDITTPGDDDITTPGDGDITTPGDDDITTPGDDDITTPGDDDITTPGDDDITTPGDDDITTPGDDDITTPGDDDITTPGDDDITTSGDEDTTTPGDDTTTPGNDDLTTPGDDDTTSTRKDSEITPRGSGSSRPTSASSSSSDSTQTTSFETANVGVRNLITGACAALLTFALVLI